MTDFILRDIRIGEYTVDIKFSVKGLSIVRGHIKAESMDVGFSLSEDETLNSNERVLELLDNPAVKRLVEKFTDEVDFKPAKPANHQPKTTDTVTELCSRVNALLASLKKEREMNEKLRQTEREVCENFNRHMAKVAERTQKF